MSRYTTRRAIVLTVILLAVTAWLAYMPAPAPTPSHPGAPVQPHTLNELAYAEAMREIHGVEWVYVDASIDGGYDMCWRIDLYGLNRDGLAGLEGYIAEPWEREQAEAAVRYLCPGQ
jgi:hypothetical protein